MGGGQPPRQPVWRLPGGAQGWAQGPRVRRSPQHTPSSSLGKGLGGRRGEEPTDGSMPGKRRAQPEESTKAGLQGSRTGAKGQQDSGWVAGGSREGLWAAPPGASEAVSKAGPRMSVHQRTPGTWDQRQTRAGPQDRLPTWEGVGLQDSFGMQGPPSPPHPAPEPQQLSWNLTRFDHVPSPTQPCPVAWAPGPSSQREAACCQPRPRAHTLYPPQAPSGMHAQSQKRTPWM